MRTPLLSLVVLATTLSGACAAELTPGDDEGGGPMTVDEMGGPNIGHTHEDDDVISTSVDATAEDVWVYLDLDDGQQLEVSDPRADPDWDIAFQRFNIKLNGGDSGTAGVEAILLEDMAFEDVDVAPAQGYISDLPDGDDENENPDYVFQDWYDYNIATHVLTPRPVVYVVRTAEPQHYKLQIDAYYDDVGTSGTLGFRWAWVEGP